MAVLFGRRSKFTSPLHPASRQAPIQRVVFFFSPTTKSLLFLYLLVDGCNFYDALARMITTTTTASAVHHKEYLKNPFSPLHPASLQIAKQSQNCVTVSNQTTLILTRNQSNSQTEYLKKGKEMKKKKEIERNELMKLSVGISNGSKCFSSCKTSTIVTICSKSVYKSRFAH